MAVAMRVDQAEIDGPVELVAQRLRAAHAEVACNRPWRDPIWVLLHDGDHLVSPPGDTSASAGHLRSLFDELQAEHLEEPIEPVHAHRPLTSLETRQMGLIDARLSRDVELRPS